MITSTKMRIGEGGPEVSQTAGAYAAAIHVVDNSALPLTRYRSPLAAFQREFPESELTVVARRRDWWAGLKFHPSKPWLRGDARSAYLLKKLEAYLDSHEPKSLKQAGLIAELFAIGAWWNGYYDVAIALWHRSAAFMTGHGITVAFVDPEAQKTIMRSLAGRKVVSESDIAAKLPAELNMGDSWPYFTYHSFTKRLRVGNTTGTYAYETPFAFRPVVLRFFPKTRTIHSPDLQTHYYVEPEKIRKGVNEELAQLDAWTEAGISTAAVLARGDNWYARERIVGPKKDRLRTGSFYGLSKDAASEAAASWSRIPNALVEGGFMSNDQAHTFAEYNTAYNLVNGTWTALRPACSIDNMRHLT